MNVHLLISQLIASAIVYAISVFAWRRKRPMYFFIGVETNASRIKDVAKFNHWIAFIWFLYGSSFLGIGLIHLLGQYDLSVSLTQSVPLIGILFVVVAHGGVYLMHRQ